MGHVFTISLIVVHLNSSFSYFFFRRKDFDFCLKLACHIIPVKHSLQVVRLSFLNMYSKILKNLASK